MTELEAMLEEVNNERDQKERKLNDTLKAMSQENYELRRSLEELRREIRAFSSSRPYNDIASPRLEQTSHILHQQPYSPSSNPPSNVRHSSISYPPSMNQMASPAPSLESPMDVLDRVLELRLPVPEEQPKNKELPQQQQQDDGDCGVCIKEDCICETLGIREKRDTPASSPAVNTAVESQQPAPGTVQLKRRRKSVSKNLNPFKKMKKTSKPEEMEVDFTKVFAKEAAPEPPVAVEAPAPQPEAPEVEVIHSSTSTPMDPCGFCSDGTPCLCAETAEQEASSMADLNTLPPLVGINQNNGNSHNNSSPSVSLPSSRNGSISNLVKLPALNHEASGASTPKSGCTGKPGTCQQCQADPMSTLFCTTLANQVATTKPAVKPAAKPAGGCCGGSKSGGGGCCKDKAATSSKPQQQQQQKQQQQQQFQQQLFQRQHQQTPTGSGASTPLPSAGTFIPCSAAYQTLSRHKDFRRVDLGTLVGKLQTRGMQVEVSSVANVLRELDKRLYQ